MHRYISPVFAALIAATVSAAAATLEVVNVSPSGTDSATCGAAASPCKTLKQAVARVSAKGTIVIDSAGDLGPGVVIEKSLNIYAAPGAGIFTPTPPGPCITLNTGVNDVVNIRGLICDQGGTAQDGVLFNSGHKLKLDNVSVRGNGAAKCGVRFKPANGTSELIISNSTLSENATAGVNIGGGICVTPSGSAVTSGVLNNVQVFNNRHGFVSDPTGGASANFLINNSVFSGNEGGIFGVSPNSNTCVRGTTITGNSFMGVSGPVLDGGGNLNWGNAAPGVFAGNCP